MTRNVTYCLLVCSLLGLSLLLHSVTIAEQPEAQPRILGQQGPSSLQVITANNAHGLQPLRNLGGSAPTALAWSLYGDRLLVATLAGVWIYHNPPSMTPPQALPGYNGTVWDVAFSPHDNAIAVASDDGDVRLWTNASLDMAKVLKGHTDSVWRVVFSPNGNTLVSASWDGTVRWWDVQSGQEHTARRLEARSVNDIAFSPDGGVLAIAYADGRVQLWATSGDWQTPRATLHHTDGITNLAFGSQGDMLIGGSVQGALVQWDARTGERLAEWHTCTHGAVTDVEIAPTGTLWAVACEDGTVHLRDTETGRTFSTLQEHTSSVLDLAFDPRSTVLVSASYDGTVRFWNVHTGSRITVLYVGGHTGPVLDVAFSPDSRRLASSGIDGTVRLWDVESATQQRQLTAGKPIPAVAFSPRGGLLAFAGLDDKIHLWDTEADVPIAELVGHSDWIVGLAFDAEGTLLASAGWDGTVHLWQGNVAAGCGLLTHGVSIVDVAFLNGQRLASVDLNGAFYLWDLASCERLTELPPLEQVTAIAASPTGQQLAISTTDGKVQLWDANAHVVTTLHSVAPISDMAFSPDGSLLVIAEEDGTVRVDVLATGDTVATFEHVADRLYAVAFSSDGRRIAVAGENPALQLWGVPTEEEE